MLFSRIYGNTFNLVNGLNNGDFVLDNTILTRGNGKLLSISYYIKSGNTIYDNDTIELSIIRASNIIKIITTNIIIVGNKISFDIEQRDIEVNDILRMVYNRAGANSMNIKIECEILY